MLLYKIVNMSDPYTIECANLEVATVACLLLGGGQYAFEPLPTRDASAPDDSDVPMDFGGALERRLQSLGTTARQVYDRVKAGHALQLADALDSVLIGDASDRRLYHVLLNFVPQSDRAAARDAWHNERRSSMNDIGRRAYMMARLVRLEQWERLPLAPQQVFTS